MLKSLVIGSIFGILVSTASAQEYWRAIDLERALAQKEYAEQHSSPSAAVTAAFATRYVRDIFDQVTSAPFCDRKVTDAELVKVVRRHFRFNRRYMHYSAYELTAEALAINYPCN